MKPYSTMTPAELLAEHDRLLVELGEPSRPVTYAHAWFHLGNGLPGRIAKPLRRDGFVLHLRQLVDRLEEVRESYHWACRDMPTGPRYAPDNYQIE